MKEIYFDNSATTCPSEPVLALYHQIALENYGNPSSRHKRGMLANEALLSARKQLLSSLGARDGRIVFTAGGTEANNLAIFGRAFAKERYRRGFRIITSEGEHSSTSLPCAMLERMGFEVVKIPTRDGLLSQTALAEALNEKTVLVTFTAVNNETGAYYPSPSLSALVRRASPEALLHFDATQAFMKMPMTAKSLGADLITLSSHKIEGPKGVGALYVAEGVIKSRGLSPMVFGGGQEDGLRSGTENVPGACAFAEAARLATLSFAERIARINAVRTHLLAALAAHPVLKDTVVPNIPKGPYAPHILSLTVTGFKSETVLNDLSGRGIYVSSGSACASHARNLSEALLAFGKTEEQTDATIRLSFSHHNTENEADIFLDALCDIVRSRAKIR